MARMSASLPSLAIIAALALLADAGHAGPSANVRNGKRLYIAVGCYTCHGTTGTGAITGPKLAPNPIPLPAFLQQLRQPIGAPSYGNLKMPAYTEALLSDEQIADIYAYLASIPLSPPASQIPLLNEKTHQP